MKKILFITSHRQGRTPGQRFRFEQYLAYLQNNDFTYDISCLINEDDDKVLYQKGEYLKKLKIVLKSYKIRRQDLRRANQYDIIFIYREALLTRSTYFERMFRNTRAKLIFDFDDAIWLMDVSNANKSFRFLKNPGKTAKIIALVDIVFAGNHYLAHYAKQFNKNVRIIPTTIDTDEYKRMERAKNDNKICIGWSGSITTIKHFEYAIPFLLRIKEKYGGRVAIKVIGDAGYHNAILGITGLAWNKADEIKELSSFDIGIMPLPDDEWAKGKCGLKGLQYMALSIPTLMSPVGVNNDIIKDGKNGFLPRNEDEWVAKISNLIESETLRNKIGIAARKTVEDNYSVYAQRHNYLGYFNELLEETNDRI